MRFGSNWYLFDLLRYREILSVLGYNIEFWTALYLSMCAIELGHDALETAQGLADSRTIAKDDDAGTAQQSGVAGFAGVLHAAIRDHLVLSCLHSAFREYLVLPSMHAAI